MSEIEKLIAMGIPRKCTAMQAIGYKEFLAALDGHCSLEEAAQLVKQGSRHYAKRQLTWFRRNQNIHWLRRSNDFGSEEILAAARRLSLECDN